MAEKKESTHGSVDHQAPKEVAADRKAEAVTREEEISKHKLKAEVSSAALDEKPYADP